MLLLAVFAGVGSSSRRSAFTGSGVTPSRSKRARIALGAKRSHVLGMTLTQGLKLVVAGLAVGLIGALILTRVMSSLLFSVNATDPLTYLSISVVLLAVAAFANYLPALRATGVDPMIALRAQ